jgi:hypothetical protein
MKSTVDNSYFLFLASFEGCRPKVNAFRPSAGDWGERKCPTILTPNQLIL